MMNDIEHQIYLENCQKMLQMVGVLYNRGYMAIRPLPNVREGTGRWRLFLSCGESNLIAVHQWFADLGLPEMADQEYEKTSCALTVDELAEKFIQDHHEWLQESKFNSIDEIFIKWYQVFLTTLKVGDSVYTSASDINSPWIVRNENLKVISKVIPHYFSSLSLPLSVRIKFFLKSLRKQPLKESLLKN